MQRDPVMLAVGLVLFVVLVGMWAWWARSRLARRRRLGSWRRVLADVVEVRRTQQSATVQEQTQRYVVVHVDYEFTDPAGTRQSGSGQVREKVEEGGQVEVVHDPDAPARHELVAAPPVWGTLLLLGVLSLLLLGAAIITTALGLGYE